MEELGSSVADQEGEVCDAAAARGPNGPQAGGGVQSPQRGLVALGRARSDAGGVAGVAVRDEGGVFAGGANLRRSVMLIRRVKTEMRG